MLELYRCQPEAGAPTYAGYLNGIESDFGPIGEFVVKIADHLVWDSFALAMRKHISYRNQPLRASNDSYRNPSSCVWPPER